MDSPETLVHIMDNNTYRSREPWLTNDKAAELLVVVKELYPCLVIVVFLVAFISRTIYTTRKDPAVEESPLLGPGGRPLPQRRKSAKRMPQTSDRPDFSPSTKLFVNWMMVVVLMSFLANAVAIIVQTIAYRKESWWCGQSAVVCRSADIFLEPLLTGITGLRYSVLLRLGSHTHFLIRHGPLSHDIAISSVAGLLTS